jgi:hypothetical protein
LWLNDYDAFHSPRRKFREGGGRLGLTIQGSRSKNE